MARWLTKLNVDYLRGRRDSAGRSLWRLKVPLGFESDLLKRRLIVPPEFITNYASVPRMPVVFLVAGDRSYDEAALHDWLYTCHEVTKEQADAVFLEALLLNDAISPLLAKSMHKAVSWFGGGAWDDSSSIGQPAEIQTLIQASLSLGL